MAEGSVRLGHGATSTHVTLNFDTGMIELEAGKMSVQEWKGIGARMDKVLLRQKLIDPPPALAPRSHGSPVKVPPWFLRPWYTKVQPKEKAFYD